MQKTALVIDDDPHIRRLLTRALRDEGFVVSTAESGEEGLRLAPQKLPDVILLDVYMPGMSGLETCQALKRRRETRSIPVLIMTGDDREGQEAISLELGADDYLPKPLKMALLMAHIRALLRRGPYLDTKSTSLEKGPVTLDLENKAVVIGGATHSDLTPKEFDMLVYLFRNDTPVSRDVLYRKVWGTPSPDPSALRTVDVHVQRIRSKLSLARKNGIVAVSGRGYRWIFSSEQPEANPTA